MTASRQLMTTLRSLLERAGLLPSLMVLFLALLTAMGCDTGEAREYIEAHKTAQRAIDNNQDGAASRLEKLARQTPPSGVQAMHALALRKDAFHRLAQAALPDDPQRAHDLCDAGLALGESNDVFTVNLHMTRGAALEALGREADAALDYHRALTINDELLQDALGRAASEAETP